MSAANEAREVEVVARAIFGRRIQNAAPFGEAAAWVYAEERARAALAVLEPIRAAERQEAAREATQEAWTEAAGLLDALHVSARAIGGTAAQLDGIRGARLALLDVLDDLRADGVTGRSET